MCDNTRHSTVCIDKCKRNPEESTDILTHRVTSSCVRESMTARRCCVALSALSFRQVNAFENQ